jgi:hypothetical protein
MPIDQGFHGQQMQMFHQEQIQKSQSVVLILPAEIALGFPREESHHSISIEPLSMPGHTHLSKETLNSLTQLAANPNGTVVFQ